MISSYYSNFPNAFLNADSLLPLFRLSLISFVHHISIKLSVCFRIEIRVLILWKNLWTYIYELRVACLHFKGRYSAWGADFMFTAMVQSKAKTLPRITESRDVKDRKGHPACQFFTAHCPLLPFLIGFLF